MIHWAPEAVTLIGLAMYLFLSNAKGVRIGEIMFFAGLLVSLSHGPINL